GGRGGGRGGERAPADRARRPGRGRPNAATASARVVGRWSVVWPPISGRRRGRAAGVEKAAIASMREMRPGTVTVRAARVAVAGSTMREPLTRYQTGRKVDGDVDRGAGRVHDEALPAHARRGRRCGRREADELHRAATVGRRAGGLGGAVREGGSVATEDAASPGFPSVSASLTTTPSTSHQVWNVDVRESYQ